MSKSKKRKGKIRGKRGAVMRDIDGKGKRWEREQVGKEERRGKRKGRMRKIKKEKGKIRKKRGMIGKSRERKEGEKIVEETDGNEGREDKERKDNGGKEDGNEDKEKRDGKRLRIKYV